MKNLFKSLMLVAVAALAFTACQKDNNELDYKQAPVEVNYTFTANFDTTRASFGELEEGVYPVSWDQDEVFEFSGDIMDGSGSVNADCTFSPTTTEFTDANGVVFTVTSFPHDWMKSIADNSVVKAYVKNNAVPYGRVSLDGIQKPTATSVDPNFVGLVANFEITSAAEANFEGTFEHVVAYGKLNIPAIEGVEYQSVIIEFEYATEYGSNTASYELNVAGLEEPSYFFACEPLAATKVVVSVVGADATTGAAKLYTYEKSFDEGSELTFTAGHVRPVTITGEFEEMAPYYAEAYTSEDYYTGANAYYLYVYSAATDQVVYGISVCYFDYYGVLLEGEYDMMETYDFNENSHNINGIKYYYGMSYYSSSRTEPVQSQLIVDYLEEGYRLTYNYILEGETYSVVYEGKVKNIWNPGDLLPLLTPQISASATSDSITFSWEQVDNAASYEVTFGEETFTQSETTYTATGLEADTNYTISVVACPAEGSADYTNSEAGVCEYKTTKDYSNYAYDIKLTRCVAVNGNTFEFVGANANDYLKIGFNPGLSSIDAGNYVGQTKWDSGSGTVWSSASALEFDAVSGYSMFNLADKYNNYQYYVNDGVATVVINDDGTYTLDVRVGNAYYFPGEIVRFTYTGALEPSVTYGMTEPTNVVVEMSEFAQPSYYVTFTDATGNALVILYHKGAAYLKGYSYYKTAEGVEYNVTSCTSFEYTDNGDGSYTFATVEVVDANYVTHKFSNLTFKDGELVGEGGSDDEGEVVETKLYLNPGPWAVDGAWFAAYFFGDDGNTWANMTLVEGATDVYEVVVPEGDYANVIFVRMNPAVSEFSWDDGKKWNQTEDLTIPADENTLYTITGWGNDKSVGEWGVYDPNASTGGDEEEGLKIVSAYAVHADPSFLGGTAYDVTFVGANDEKIVYQVQTKDHTYLREGKWNGTDFTNSDEGYINSVTWPGVGQPWPYTMTVAVVDDNYEILLEVNDYKDNSKYYSVSYVGKIDGFTLPVEDEGGDDSGDEGDDNQGGDTVDAEELTITNHFTIYSTGGEHELGFYYDEDNAKFVDLDFLANPITAGTYTLKNGLSGMYCKSHGGYITDCTVIVTDNGDGTLTFDATFQAGDKNWYHFTYTAKIYS